MEDEIEELREHLNKMIENKDADPESILRLSQELDLLIVEHYNTHHKEE